MSVLETINLQNWEGSITSALQETAVRNLENGKVLFMPELAFVLKKNELKFLKPEVIDPQSKNISFDGTTDLISGTTAQGQDAAQLKEMIVRYSKITYAFLKHLIPYYASSLVLARTSFRPVEILGRDSADYRSNDSLLHVDAFPSTPTKGMRILRVFTNINEEGQPRVWRVGEPLENVYRRFLHKISPPIFGSSLYLKLTGKTKDFRSPYDHYMLQVHDTMKGDADYQKTVHQEEISFPAGSSWIVYTDQVSHAAISGKDVLEQTFYLPPTALNDPSTSPLSLMEKILNKSMV